MNHPFLARTDPTLEGLREDPRFARLMETVRERWERFEVPDRKRDAIVSMQLD